MRTIAALYVDPRGPYPAMPGVDCWDEARDARLYDGPHPVVAHPPCGPWGRLRAFCTRQSRVLGPLAVFQVRKWGGVLEHPEGSTLWRALNLPRPGESSDARGGRTYLVDQVGWGHSCRKSTWLYVVGVPHDDVVGRILDGADLRARPTHVIATTRRRRGPGLPELTVKWHRAISPPAFAAWLVEIARASRVLRRTV